LCGGALLFLTMKARHRQEESEEKAHTVDLHNKTLFF
jgi:hypothetical protein